MAPGPARRLERPARCGFAVACSYAGALIALTLLARLRIEREPPFDGRVLRDALAQPIVRTARAGTPATRVRGGTSAVTTLPAATND